MGVMIYFYGCRLKSILIETLSGRNFLHRIPYVFLNHSKYQYEQCCVIFLIREAVSNSVLNTSHHSSVPVRGAEMASQTHCISLD